MLLVHQLTPCSHVPLSLSDLGAAQGVLCIVRLRQADGRLLGLVPCWERPLPPFPISSKKLKTERPFYVADKWLGSQTEFWNHILPDLPSTNHPASPIKACCVSWQRSRRMSGIFERSRSGGHFWVLVLVLPLPSLVTEQNHLSAPSPGF